MVVLNYQIISGSYNKSFIHPFNILFYSSTEPNTTLSNYTSTTDNPSKTPEESNDYECIELYNKKCDTTTENNQNFSFSTCAVYGLHKQDPGKEHEEHYAAIH